MARAGKTYARTFSSTITRPEFYAKMVHDSMSETELTEFKRALKALMKNAHRHLRRWQAHKCRGTYSRTRTEDSGGQAASSSVRTFHSSRWVWRRQQPRIP